MKELTPQNNSPPQQSDPRIDELIQGYARLSEQVETLMEQVKKQQDEPNKSQGKSKENAVQPEQSQEEQNSQESQSLPLSPESQLISPPEQPAEDDNVQQSKKPSQKRRGLKIFGSVVFYTALLLLIVSALLIRAAGNGSPHSFAGFTGMVVMSESMQSEIPKGSLVVAQHVDPKTLKIGDDITCLANPTTTVTHRIVGIIENYENTGQRAFQTQGIMNPHPDKLPVPAANVVGKVVYHSIVLGMIAEFISKYWVILLLALVLIIVLTALFKRLYGKSPQEPTPH